MRTIRSWWWRHVRRYPCEICDRCGRPVEVVWLADDALWDEIVASSDPILCVRCFDHECAVVGIIVSWDARELVRAGDPFVD